MCQHDPHVTVLTEEPDQDTVAAWLRENYRPERLARDPGCLERLSADGLAGLLAHGYTLISHHDARNGCGAYLAIDPAALGWLGPHHAVPMPASLARWNADADARALVRDWLDRRTPTVEPRTPADPMPQTGDVIEFWGWTWFRYAGPGLAGNDVLALPAGLFTLTDDEMDYTGPAFDLSEHLAAPAFIRRTHRHGKPVVVRLPGDDDRDPLDVVIGVQVWRIQAPAPTGFEPFIYGGDQN
ncbi:hypothetical protein ACWDUL_21255 [Nocardia niigatensis]